MRVFLSAVAMVMAMAATAQAQTHPCDVQQPTVYREPASSLPNLRLGWCFEPVDEDGFPLQEQVAFSLQINGGPDIDLGVVQPAIGSPNAQGSYYFEVQTPRLSAGVLAVKARTASLGMSAASPSITLTLRGRPKAPTNSTVIRGGNE